MSRIGKKPIPMPKGVKVQIGDGLLVEGPKGKLSVPVPQGIRVRQVDGHLEITRDGDQYAGKHGLTRALGPPDPYKNKGVRYTGEALRKKAGKTGAGGK
jgi:ribosomal protein L6P/L9E